ncbi:MAG TPA: PRC-barrel domain-containing protein [Ktedonobacterales bacterium]|jgi:hypothetical protein|nr:PRC-barrel domain-containing protein [Ktedonobacterales bacterium]
MPDHDAHDNQIERNATSAKQTGGHDLDGWNVYDAAGEKLGRVIGGTRDGKYFTLEKGQLFTTDYYVPMSAVARLDDGNIYLNVSADDVTSSGWQDPPVGYESGGQFREHTDVAPSSPDAPPER